MIKRFYLALAVGFFVSSICVAEEVNQAGVKRVDESLFNKVRDRYNGIWIAGGNGQATGEVLRNGSVLIEFRDRTAEAAFYHMRQAQEDIQYIPAATTVNRQGVETVNSGWLNYFNRLGKSLFCGFSSNDLAKAPFPKFVCRFTIDSDGQLQGFLDRSTAHSTSKPPTGDDWETGLEDFHWRPLQGLHSNISLNANTGYGYEIRIDAPLANVIYDTLDAPEEETIYHWGQPLNVKIKRLGYVFCHKVQSVDAECRLDFESHTGKVLPYHIE